MARVEREPELPLELPAEKQRSIPIDPLWEPITRGDVLYILDALGRWEMPLLTLKQHLEQRWKVSGG